VHVCFTITFVVLDHAINIKSTYQETFIMDKVVTPPRLTDVGFPFVPQFAGNTRRRRVIKALFAAGMLIPLSSPVLAQAYPNKSIRWIVPFPAGGPADAVARVIGRKLSETIGQQIIVDNRPGGNGIIAAEIVAQSPPDGYTLFQAIDSSLTMNQSLYSKLPYDPITGFTPITQLATLPLVLVVNPAVPAKTLKELVTLAKTRPGQLNYGSGAIAAQVAGELFKSTAQVDVVHVPYKGSAPQVQGLLGGEVHLSFDGISTTLPHIKAGKLRALAVTGDERHPRLPDIPTVAEAGFPELKIVLWHGLMALLERHAKSSAN
jgi:tripartite-type tricarboxylate transporter receptor subunit TctC